VAEYVSQAQKLYTTAHDWLKTNKGDSCEPKDGPSGRPACARGDSSEWRRIGMQGHRAT
jgi:hypothetical protein